MVEVLSVTRLVTSHHVVRNDAGQYFPGWRVVSLTDPQTHFDTDLLLPAAVAATLPVGTTLRLALARVEDGADGPTPEAPPAAPSAHDRAVRPLWRKGPAGEAP
jgi:hypothetical protein